MSTVQDTTELAARVRETEVAIAEQQTNIRNISSQIQGLTNSVNELRGSVQKIEAALGGIGKLSSSQLLAQLGSVIAAVTFLGSVYVSPLSTKLENIEQGIGFRDKILEREDVRLAELLKQHNHPEIERLDERLQNKVDALRSEIVATRDLLRAEMTIGRTP